MTAKRKRKQAPARITLLTKQPKKGKNSKTGDNSHILFYAALAAAALAAGSAEVYRRRRRATGRNKHDR
ncbi:MAG: sortase B protein-sorting domain-containing protein [Anaerobutyricum hallii]